jgi:hypothetical protein
MNNLLLASNALLLLADLLLLNRLGQINIARKNHKRLPR